MKKPEKHNDFNIISETTETALTVDMKDELAKLLEGYARGGIPEKEERALIRDMYIGWAVRDILKKTLKELKRTDPKSMLEDVLRERPRYAERLDEACNSRPIHNETLEEEPKPPIFCTDWLRAQPLRGENSTLKPTAIFRLAARRRNRSTTIFVVGTTGISIGYN